MSVYATLHQFAQLYAPLRHFTLFFFLRHFYATLLYLGTPVRKYSSTFYPYYKQWPTRERLSDAIF